MSLKLDENSNIYKYGTRKNIQYLFTEDHMFGLEVINRLMDSNYLYVNIDATIDTSSPLGKFIADGFIIKVDENDEVPSGDILTTVVLSGEILNSEIRSNQKNNAMELEKKIDVPIILNYQTRAEVSVPIKGQFYKYRFHRPLLDLRWDKKGQLITDSEDTLNENDCLNFGESSTAKYMGIENYNISAFPYRYEASFLESKETGIPFGVSDELNMEMLQNIQVNRKNNYAVPEQGECYAMVRKELRESVMYHIGFCVYSHNGVNITLEANADNGREYLPSFGFYDRGQKGLTFYKRYTPIYDNGETIVLKGRNINEILQEINQEIIQKGNANNTKLQRVTKKIRRLSSFRKLK